MTDQKPAARYPLHNSIGLARWINARVDLHFGGNLSAAARAVGVPQPVLWRYAHGRGGKSITWQTLEKLQILESPEEPVFGFVTTRADAERMLRYRRAAGAPLTFGEEAVYTAWEKTHGAQLRRFRGECARRGLSEEEAHDAIREMIRPFCRGGLRAVVHREWAELSHVEQGRYISLVTRVYLEVLLHRKPDFERILWRSSKATRQEILARLTGILGTA